MSYAGFCDVCNVPYYEAQACQHQHGGISSNGTINKEFAPKVEALRREIESAEQAASVQQEPLNAEYVDLLLRFRELGAVRLSPSAAEQDEMEDLLDALKSQPAAPRTQGRDQTFEQFWVSTNNSNYFSERTITPEILKQVANESWNMSLAQARTQPAPCPVCPKCGSDDLLTETSLKPWQIYCHKCRTEYDLSLENIAQFFTALPEAQPTNKEEPK